ncbi:hypothetical protein [Acidovorax sp. SUPP3334]|uniref:hypothetical protein n=1 Tax=Acidovorax sp. SUPP3334 TaxID=2920881 RepID=UPI0023DE3196|nr:hypothetical protein [Acidovorax sp. SUPP3334]GKT22637.1 hypothetical protein AVHM3334_09060 [Acidovorax sp. SUPP3334]
MQHITDACQAKAWERLRQEAHELGGTADPGAGGGCDSGECGDVEVLVRSAREAMEQGLEALKTAYADRSEDQFA